MPSRTVAGKLALKGDWDLGENNWKDEMDANLLKLSVLVQGSVQDIIAAEPGSPAEGDVIVLDDTNVGHPNNVAAYDEAAWHYFEPWDGLVLWNEATSSLYTYSAAGGWVELEGGITIQADQVGDYQPVLTDANTYIPMNKATAQTFTVPAAATVAFPVGTRIIVEQRGAGTVTFVGAAGVTLRSRGAVLATAGQYAVAQIIHRSLNTWVITGDVA